MDRQQGAGMDEKQRKGAIKTALVLAGFVLFVYLWTFFGSH